MATHATHVPRRWTPGRWFGVVILGALGWLVSVVAYGVIEAQTETMPFAASLLGIPLILSVAAVLVGIVGAAVSLIRGH